MNAGTLVAGRFEIVELTARGGMGEVYRAHDRASGETVAVKLLARGAEVGRFAREASLLAALEHPAIVRYIAHGTSGSEPFVAMEWLAGESLSLRLGRGPLSIADTIAVGQRVAAALAAAHQAGIVHRDVKPSNVLLIDGAVAQAKLIDFGIAKHAARARKDEDTLTRTGIIVGTPGYLAPEQARGERDIDARADVFALGSVLFKCLTGRMPFVGESAMAVLAKIVLEDAPAVRELRPDVPPALGALIARMLAKDPAARPADGQAVLLALEALALGAASLSVPPPSLTGGEQRLLSVVLVGSSGADERPRAVLDALDFSIAELADGSLLVPLVSEGSATDQALRAARCALALRRELRGPMVLATGTGVVARPGPVGDVIDRAVGLLRSAPSSAGVVTDEVTARLLGPRFALGPHHAAGDARAFLLTGEREHGDGGRTLLGRPSPFVGRDRELSTLLSIYDECVADRAARIVLVTGAAGVGKSRLRLELCRHLAARAPAPELWIARCDPMSAGSSFGVIASWLRAAADLSGGEPHEQRRAQLCERLGRHLRGADTGALEFLCEVAGAPLSDEHSAPLRAARRDAKLMGDQIRRAWEDFLRAACASHAVVLVVEDLQWGDVPSVRLIDAAVGHLYEAPLYVLALARPDFGEQFPGCWDERGVQRLALGQLGAKASAALVREMLGETIGDTVTARIVSQASGNALYLEELIRATAEGRAEVPGSVLAMLHARIAELGDDVRRALRAASVFGQAFWRGGVAALLGEDPAAVTAWITDLIDHEVVARRAHSRFPTEDEYVFRHALVRDAAYTTLTDADRELGHQIAGAWLHDAGERDAMVLAEHFERGAQAERAVTWYRRAAEQALGGNDLTAAIARAERAVACGALGETLGEVRVLETEALEWQGASAEAIRCAREAMRVLPAGAPSWFRALTAAITVAGNAGDLPELRALVDELPAEAALGEGLAFQATCTSRAALHLFIAGDKARADVVLAQASALCERLAPPIEPAVRAWLAQARGWQRYYAGDMVQSFQLDSAAAEAFMEAGDVRNACRQLGNAGFAQVLLGAYADAERILREALDDAERLGIPLVCCLALQNLGIAVGAQGRNEEALGYEMRAVELGRSQRMRRLEGISRVYLAVLHGWAGDLAAAEEQVRASLPVLEVVAPSRPFALGVLADVLLRRGRVSEALDAAREAFTLIESLEAIDEGDVLVRLALCEALDAAGEKSEARRVLERARALLLDRAARLSDPASRATFLQAVRENARTLALAAEWLDG